eukprot:SAG31_NODE_14499_length_803_cov_1.122159_2_plen_98_part_00
MLRVVLGALSVETPESPAARVDLERITAEQGQLARVQAELRLQDPAGTCGPSLALALQELLGILGAPVLEQMSQQLDPALQLQLQNALAGQPATPTQ